MLSDFFPLLIFVQTVFRNFHTISKFHRISQVSIKSQIIEDENLQENSKTVGTYLLERLAVLRNQHPEVGDVRGKGLMIGVEMVRDSESRVPLPPTAVQAIWETCRELGLLIGLGGYHSNVSTSLKSIKNEILQINAGI